MATFIHEDNVPAEIDLSELQTDFIVGSAEAMISMLGQDTYDYLSDYDFSENELAKLYSDTKTNISHMARTNQNFAYAEELKKKEEK